MGVLGSVTVRLIVLTWMMTWVTSCAGSALQGSSPGSQRSTLTENKPSGDGRRPSEQGEGIAGYLTDPGQVSFQESGSAWVIAVKGGVIRPQQDHSGEGVAVCIQALVSDVAARLRSTRGSIPSGPDLQMVLRGVTNSEGGFDGRIPIPTVSKDSVLVFNVSSLCAKSGLAMEEDGKATAVFGPLVKGTALTGESPPKEFVPDRTLSLLQVPSQIAVPDRAFSFQLQGQSTGGSPLTYRCQRECPEGLRVEGTTGMVTWTPPDSLAGQSRTIVFSVTDGVQQKEATMEIKLGIVCGANPASSCYSGTDGQKAQETGFAVTPSGKRLVWTNSALWTEKGGTRILKPDGTDAWATALAPNGLIRTGVDLNFNSSNVIGRTCPLDVFVPMPDSDAGLTASGRCLYYDGGNPVQALNKSGTGQTTIGSIGLGNWDSSGSGNGADISWYEGNIDTCASKGMRLPTLYETAAVDPLSENTNKTGAPQDATPRYSGPSRGVPSVDGMWTWTASSRFSINDPTGRYNYWAWGTGAGDTAGWTSYAYPDWGRIRCVLP